MSLSQLLIANARAANNSFQLNSFGNLINPIKNNNFNSVVGTLIGVVLTVAGLVAFIYLIIAGFQYITAGGDAAKATAARQAIINAIIGVIVIVIAWTVLTYATGLFK